MSAPRTAIRRLSSEECLALAPIRASLWKGPFTEAQFIQRNQVLYSGEFVREYIQSFGLFLEGEPIPAASCDFVRTYCLDSTEPGVHRCQVLASAVTLPQFQKRGLMSELLHHAFPLLKDRVFLYSDLQPGFYRRFGFVEDTWGENTEAVSSASVWPPSHWKPLSRAQFEEQWRLFQRRKIEQRMCEIALVPDVRWMEWTESRYRFYETARGEAPRPLFFYGALEGTSTAVPVAFFWDRFRNQIDVAWAENEHISLWMPAAQALASSLHATKVRWFARQTSDRPPWPMYHAKTLDFQREPSRKSMPLEIGLADFW